MRDFARLDVAQSLAALDVDAANGLADADVTQRRAEHGPNSLPSDQGINWLQLILGQFRDLMVVILLVAAGISWFLGDVKDVVVILAIVLLNAALGISQELSRGTGAGPPSAPCRCRWCESAAGVKSSR